MAVTFLAFANDVFGKDMAGFALAGEIPDSIPPFSSFVGVLNNNIIIAGGAALSAPGNRVLFDDIYIGVRQEKGYQWQKSPCTMPQAVAGGITIQIENAMLCLGGRHKDGLNQDVILLESVNDVIQARRITQLPHTAAVVSGCAFKKGVYVLMNDPAAADTYRLWRYDMVAAEWEQRHVFATPYSLACQNDGVCDCVYLLSSGKGTSKNYRYQEGNAALPAVMSEVSPPPEGWYVTDVNALGASHILCLFEEGSLYAYHTITDTWVKQEGLPALLSKSLLFHDNNKMSVLISRDDNLSIKSIYTRTIPPDPKHFIWLDYLVFVIYLVLLVAIGMYFSKRGKTTSDYFLGGKRIPWWAAGLSIMATQVSSIGFMAIPAKSYAANWQYFVGVLSWFVVVPIVIRYFIPFFCKLNITTAYEYLEYRFNYAVRCFVSMLFLLMQLARMAIVLYLPSLALTSVTDMDPRVCVIIMGVLCTLYTVAGGIEAVIWTDVVQAFLLIGGALFCVCLIIFGFDQGPGAFWDIAIRDNKFDMVQHGFSPAMPALWVILVGNVFTRFSALTSDQTVVQRYLTTSNIKQAARSLWVDVAASIPWAVIVFLFGTALYAFYKVHPEKLDPNIATDGIVPFFIAQQLPPGLSGLIISAIFAAAMSSLDSSIHSSATVLVNDFYARLAPKSTEKQRLVLARILVIVLGLFATGFALIIAGRGIASLWDMFIEITGLMSGPMAGIFILGLFFRKTNGYGVLCGAFLSVIILVVIKNSGFVHFFLYTAIGLILSLVLGYIISKLFFDKPSK